MKLTSGSTGLPRATLTTEAQLIADTRQIQAAMDIVPTDTQMADHPAVARLRHERGTDAIAAARNRNRPARVVRAGAVAR